MYKVYVKELRWQTYMLVPKEIDVWLTHTRLVFEGTMEECEKYMEDNPLTNPYVPTEEA